MTSAGAVALRDLAVMGGLVGGPFGSSLVGSDYTASGVPVIRGANLGHGRFVGGDFVYVSMEKATGELARNQARPGDLVFTQRGTLGQIAVVPEGGADAYVVSQSQMRLRVDPARADPRFVYYACTTSDFVQQVHDHAIATGVPHINLGILGALRVPDIPRREQRAIAEVLGALDDKIAANTRLATTADEYLAEVLDQSLRAAEPTMVRLDEIARVNARSVKTAVGTIRYIDISSVGVGEYDAPSELAWPDAPSRARRGIAPGDTIWSTVRPNRRSHALVLSDDPDLVGSTGLAVLTPTAVSFAYLYEVTRRPEFVAYLETVAEGSAYPAVRADRFGAASVPLLSRTGLDAFADVAEPLRRRLATARDENRSLAATRDALLPALMSGTLRVRDAERVVEEVV